MKPMPNKDKEGGEKDGFRIVNPSVALIKDIKRHVIEAIIEMRRKGIPSSTHKWLTSTPMLSTKI